MLCSVRLQKKNMVGRFLTWFCVTSVNQTGRSMKTGLKLTIIFEFQVVGAEALGETDKLGTQ